MLHQQTDTPGIKTQKKTEKQEANRTPTEHGEADNTHSSKQGRKRLRRQQQLEQLQETEGSLLDEPYEEKLSHKKKRKQRYAEGENYEAPTGDHQPSVAAGATAEADAQHEVAVGSKRKKRYLVQQQTEEASEPHTNSQQTIKKSKKKKRSKTAHEE